MTQQMNGERLRLALVLLYRHTKGVLCLNVWSDHCRIAQAWNDLESFGRFWKVLEGFGRDWKAAALPLAGGPSQVLEKLVGVRGFEPPTTASRRVLAVVLE